MVSFLRKLVGDPGEKIIDKIRPIVPRINAVEGTMQQLSDQQLRDKTEEFKGRLAKGETLDDLLPEAFAVVRETAWRRLGQRHSARGGAAEGPTRTGRQAAARRQTRANRAGPGRRRRRSESDSRGPWPGHAWQWLRARRKHRGRSQSAAREDRGWRGWRGTPARRRLRAPVSG